MALDVAPTGSITPPGSADRRTATGRTADSRTGPLVPGLGALVVGTLLALAAEAAVGVVGVLTWAVLLGALASNLDLLPAEAGPGLHLATRRLLRLGIVLLGFSLSLGAVAALGLPVIGLVVVTLLSTLLLTTWLGLRLGLGRPRSLLIGTGFAICGASAIAAMEENAEADDDDVAVAVAMVTLCGTVAMVAIPLLQAPLGLSDAQLGVWAGAGVHEVGQVVAAAGPAGAAAVALAVAVKLTRVLLLAPVVAGVSVLRRRRAASDGTRGTLPPLVPGFVLAFLGCVLVSSTGVLPAALLGAIGHLQTLALAGALFGMGTGVHLRRLARNGSAALVVATVSTLVVGGVSLIGVLTVL